MEAWSTPDGLESCGAEGQINENNPQVPSSARNMIQYYKSANLQIYKSAKNTLNSPEFQLLSMERHDCPFAEAEPLWLPMVPGGRVGSSTNVSVQGEANSNFERDLYNCTFPTLIGEQKNKI